MCHGNQACGVPSCKEFQKRVKAAEKIEDSGLVYCPHHNDFHTREELEKEEREIIQERYKKAQERREERKQRYRQREERRRQEREENKEGWL